MDDSACSVASLRANESLVGTAVESVDRWLLLEVTDSWHPKVLQSEALSEPVRAVLSGWLEAPRSRLQLIRRPGSGKRPLFMDVRPDRTHARVELDRHEDLLALDLEALPVEPMPPTALVCVHGRRDRCCAQHGSAVYRALQGNGIDAWQTSHLGGHRFAACTLSLPDGLMYGRMRAGHVEAWVAAMNAGEVGDLDSLRGRCAYDRPTQAAEIFLRKRGGERAANALEWIETTPDGDLTWTVRFQTAAGERSVGVRLQDTGELRPASCGGEPECVTRFEEQK